ncbi:hypothetical protein MKW92_009349 [Papaver armeniacum]|nr:hypothetical protein MKW92_009349 [Papaver armeniacum]
MADLMRRRDDLNRSLLVDQVRLPEDYDRSFNRSRQSMGALVEVLLDIELLKREDITRHMKKIIILDDGEVCSVCLQDMINVGDDAVLLKCSHIFHKKCMLEWSKRKLNCPICRHDSRKESIKRKRLTDHDEEPEG